MWAWYLEQAGELGGQTFPIAVTGHAFEVKTGMASNTTIGVVATDAALNHEDLQRLAMMSQDGYARAIRPVHIPFDGDTLFAISTEAVPVAQQPVTLLRLGTIAADVVARADHARRLPCRGYRRPPVLCDPLGRAEELLVADFCRIAGSIGPEDEF